MWECAKSCIKDIFCTRAGFEEAVLRRAHETAKANAFRLLFGIGDDCQYKCRLTRLHFFEQQHAAE